MGSEVMLMKLVSYDRNAVVTYAGMWAYGRNPIFYDYEKLGGDCTNFASQCVYAGSKIMNFTPTYGWYYIDTNDKAPAWTGVPFFYNFMTRKEKSIGPVAIESDIAAIRPGDVIQLSFQESEWNHTPVVIRVEAPDPSGIYLAAHSYDAYNRPLSSYQYRDVRYLHFTGVWKPE